MENTATPQPKFKRGDVVHLNSNPERLMTVMETGEYTTCIWFKNGSDVESDEFHEDCLTLV